MVLKRIDRYITWRFLAFLAGVVCLLGFLYGSFDLLKRVEDVSQAQAGQKLVLLAQYYFYMIPLFLVDIVPALILVAAGVLLVQMARTRELLVLKASGVSLYRTVAPIFLCAFLISLLCFAFQQFLGPRFARQSEMLDKRIDEKVQTEMLVKDPIYHRRVFVGQYDYSTQAMQSITVMDFYPENEQRLKAIMRADSGKLNSAGELTLQGVTVQAFDLLGKPRPLGSPLPTAKLQTGLIPFDFLRAAQSSDQQSMVMDTLGQLRQQIRRNPNVPDFRVVYHSRLAAILSPIILLLVGIPCLIGFETTVKSRFLGVIVSILVAACFYALGFSLSSMGATGTVNPVLAGWLPSIIGGSAGLYLFQGMHT
jgi:lipopolysaccharide export system permease protein